MGPKAKITRTYRVMLSVQTVVATKKTNPKPERPARTGYIVLRRSARKQEERTQTIAKP